MTAIGMTGIGAATTIGAADIGATAIGVTAMTGIAINSKNEGAALRGRFTSPFPLSIDYFVAWAHGRMGAWEWIKIRASLPPKLL